MGKITPEILKELLSYEPETGVLRWRKHRGGTASIGTISGTVSNRGYRMVSIFGRDYQAHRLIWMYTHGAWPSEQIDHINGNKDDNRIINLREATNAENQRNSTKQKNNRSGFKGVYRRYQKGKWWARLRVDGVNIYLGGFDNPEKAAEAYAQAAQKYHGVFSRT